ncbi:hypothetical protein RYX36_005274 [Vicia faba]
MAPTKDNTSKKKKTSGAGRSRAQKSYDQTRFNGPEQQKGFLISTLKVITDPFVICGENASGQNS